MPSLAPDKPPVSKYVPPLTGIRALAAALVLGLHADQNLPVGLQSTLPLAARGYLGVDLFFILSGFIMTHVYLAGLAFPDRRAIQIFLWHRFIRLYPAHITVLAALVVVVVLAVVAGASLNNPQEWGWRQLFWQLTLLQAWGLSASLGWNVPSWSISAEWFAYLLFPLLAPALARVRALATALAIALAAWTAMVVLFSIEGWRLSSWVGAPALARVAGEFLCGAALCRAVALGFVGVHPAGDVLGFAAFAAFLLGASTGWGDFTLVLLLAGIVVGAATSAVHLRRWLGSRPLVWLGDISYSLYLVHFPALLVIRRFWERIGFAEWNGAEKKFAFLATLAAVVLLAAALFYLVERPARSRLRDRRGRLKSPS
jgi:peptidoglycan/LPS O-acetylase OafA/YrhL